MKKVAFIILSMVSLCYFSSCKKHSPTLAQVKGNWTLAANIKAINLISTGTGLIGFNSAYGEPVLYSTDHGSTWNSVFTNISTKAGFNIVVDLKNHSRVIMYSVADSTFYL